MGGGKDWGQGPGPGALGSSGVQSQGAQGQLGLGVKGGGVQGQGLPGQGRSSTMTTPMTTNTLHETPNNHQIFIHARVVMVTAIPPNEHFKIGDHLIRLKDSGHLATKARSVEPEMDLRRSRKSIHHKK